MSKQKYEHHDFKADSLTLIKQVNAIIAEYLGAGYRLTVRQLYYQLVQRAIVENTLKSYKRVASLINDAKMAGLIDWDIIEDRTREFIRNSRWESGKSILESVAAQFHMDMWANQPKRVFVIVEKEALAGVLERPCREYDMPLLAARGYPSGTVLREFSISDLMSCIAEKQKPVILHFGDHDPSGMDMSRDLSERFTTFITGSVGNGDMGGRAFQRLALNMPQIEELNPPPNPAKQSDARFQQYEQEFGGDSWELDALPPEYLDKLVRDNCQANLDQALWDERKDEIDDVRSKLQEVADNFDA